MNDALQKEEVHLVHQRNLSAVRDAASEKEALVGQLRNDIENRDARIADLEVQIGRMRKEAAEGEEALARIRIELRDANLQKATAEVHTTALQLLYYCFARAFATADCAVQDLFAKIFGNTV